MADRPIHVVAKQRLLDDFLSVDEAILDIDGQRQRRLSLERGDAVAAIVQRTDDARILLTRQFRYPTYENGPGWVVEAPAGVVEPGEDPADTMRRELAEEIGYEPHDLEPIATFYVSPGGSSERIFLFYAEVSEADRVGDGGGLDEEGEDIEIVEFTLDELTERLHAGDICDAKTLIGLQWLLLADRARAPMADDHR